MRRVREKPFLTSSALERVAVEVDRDVLDVLRNLDVGVQQDAHLARLRARVVDLEHAHALQLIGEADRAAVVAGAQDDDLLDAVGGLGQERVVEAAGAGDGEAVAARRRALKRPADKWLGQDGGQETLAQADEVLGEAVLARDSERGLVRDRCA